MTHSQLGSCEFGGRSSSEVKSTRFDLHKATAHGHGLGFRIMPKKFCLVNFTSAYDAVGSRWPSEVCRKNVEVPFSQASYIQWYIMHCWQM